MMMNIVQKHHRTMSTVKMTARAMNSELLVLNWLGVMNMVYSRLQTQTVWKWSDQEDVEYDEERCIMLTNDVHMNDAFESHWSMRLRSKDRIPQAQI